MSFDTVAKPTYPLVPAVAGVPAVLRSGAQVLDTLTLGFLGLGDLVNTIIGSEPVLWGIYDPNGKIITDYDSMVSMNYRNDSRVSDYPVENGTFASYNKVSDPFNIQIQLSCGGNLTRRAAFQADLLAAAKSLTLYTIVAEDGTFNNCNLVSLDWGRSQQDGAHIIKAFCEFREIRQRGTTAFKNTAMPSGEDIVNQGQVQPVNDPTIDASGLV